MILELLFVFAIIIFSNIAKPYKLLCLLFLLIPWHTFLKVFLFGDGGTMFSLWKEIIMLFLFLRIPHVNPLTSKLSRLLLFMAAYFVVFGIIGAVQGFPPLQDFRQYLLPTLLIIASANITLDYKELRTILYSIFIGSILINLTGVVDFAFPVLRIPMRAMMGVDFFVDPDGTIVYESGAYQMMRMDRVAGLLGPNQMGLYNAIVILFMFIAMRMGFIQNKKDKLVFYTTGALAAFCLLFSFSRAGWLIDAITFLFLGLKMKKYRKTIIQLSFVAIIVFVIAFFQVEIVNKLITGTFSGEEASAASRGSMTQDAFSVLLSNPFGVGLGATNLGVGKGFYAAESALINLGISAGIIGVFMYLYQFLYIYRKTKITASVNIIAEISAPFVCTFVLVSFISLTTVGNPFIYFAAFLMGMGLNSIVGTNIIYSGMVRNRR